MKKPLLFGCAALVVLGLCAGAAVLIFGVALTGTDTPAAGRSDSQPAAPLPPSPPFEEIRTKHETMTEVQWKEYRKTVEGTQATRWHGWVEEVDGSDTVHIDMDPPDNLLSVAEVSFKVPHDIALSLHPDQELTFSGRLDTAQDFIGTLDIELKQVVIE